MLLCAIPMKHFAQQPKLIKVSEFNVSTIPTIEERVFVLHTIVDKGYYCYTNPTLPNTIDVFVANDADDELSDFDFFYDNILFEQRNEFSLLDKATRGNLFVQWRQGLSDEVFKTIYDDFTKGLRAENASCETALPFCTNNGLYNFPAGTNAGSPCGDSYSASCGEPYHCSGDHQGQDNCLSTAPNPAFYYMRIDEPGDLNIYMYSEPSHDIDFDCWGPFDDINTACDQLSCSTMVDCCYSTSSSEHCHINGALTGQYYIILITNYSNQPCNINFENIGTGTTDCSILPPLVNNDGPYCVGETIHLTANGQPGSYYSWTGPNGFTSDQQNPVINNCTIEQSGEYTCTITVGEESNNASTTIIVNALPEASFNASTICYGTATEFTSTVTGHIADYQWDFGDGETGSGATVSHTFTAPGTYEVTHHVATSSECEGEVTQTVTVYAMPVPIASANPFSVQYSGVSTLTADAGVEGTFTYHWEPANMVVDPNSQTTQTVPLIESQVYTLTVTNTEGGCTSTTQVAVSMDGSNLTATASADTYQLCDGESTTIHAIPMGGTGNYSYSWTPTNTMSNATAKDPVVTPGIGTTTYTCHVTDGIIDADVSVSITVYPNEASEFNVAICEGESYTYFGQNLTATGDYPHTLQTTHHCDSIVTLHLTVNPTDATPTIEREDCDYYFWDKQGHELAEADNLDTITSSGTYQRVFVNQTGCDSVATTHVTLEYTPTPTPIYPLDENNTAPHWVVTSTEFQVSTYDFHLWDTNPICHWDTVYWSCDEAPDWLLEPFGSKGKSCKVYVMNFVPDTIWLTARIENRCAMGEDNVIQKYWMVCSFYGVEDNSAAADFSVVPNPNNGTMTLNFERLTGKIDMKVYDMTGNMVDHFETYGDDGISSMTYDMSTRANGIYHFVATAKEGTVSKKVVIQH